MQVNDHIVEALPPFDWVRMIDGLCTGGLV